MRDKATPPNVIVIICDQLRAFEVGCYGNEVVQTPNIDMLAREGVKFEVACTNSPVCTPSRSSLLSGQYARTCTGTVENCAEPSSVRVRLTDPTIAECFRAAGYSTAVIGKWHVDPDPGLVGFDQRVVPFWHHRNTGQTYSENGGESRVVEGWAPEFEFDQVQRYLLERPADQPFFLYYSISPPHMPLADAPTKYTRMYAPGDVPLRPNVTVNDRVAYDEEWFKIYLWDYLYYEKKAPHTQTLPKDFDLRQLSALYYGLTTWVDDLVGRLRDLLVKQEILQDTLLVFLSDHGDNLGSHHRFNKGLVLEESIRIPLLFHWPSALAPRCIDDRVVSVVDVMPTILSLVGLPIPASSQGADLGALIHGGQEPVSHDGAFIETHFHEIGLRTSTHLYGVQLERADDLPSRRVLDGGDVFFDLRTDPYQLDNLAFGGSQPTVASELRARLLEWNQQTPWGAAHALAPDPAAHGVAGG